MRRQRTVPTVNRQMAPAAPACPWSVCVRRSPAHSYYASSTSLPPACTYPGYAASRSPPRSASQRNRWRSGSRTGEWSTRRMLATEDVLRRHSLDVTVNYLPTHSRHTPPRRRPANYLHQMMFGREKERRLIADRDSSCVEQWVDFGSPYLTNIVCI